MKLLCAAFFVFIEKLFALMYSRALPVAVSCDGGLHSENDFPIFAPPQMITSIPVLVCPPQVSL